MAKKKKAERLPPTASLRARAEELLRTKPAELPTLPTADVQALVHELNVHQIELEIQNDELRQAQLELAHSRDRYSDLYDFAPVGYLTLDQDGVVLEANLTVATMLGTARKHMIGAKLSHWLAPDAQDDFYLHRRAVFSSDVEVKQTCELKMQPADTKLLVVRFESVLFGSDNGRQCRTALIDVTQESDAKEEIRQLNETLEQRVAEKTQEVELLAEAMNNLGEGVMITTDHLDWPGPQIVYVNQALCRNTGYTAEELIGQTPRILQGSQTDRAVVKRLRDELAKKRSHLCEVVNHRKDGTTYDAELFITPLFNVEGEHTHFIAIQRDITERKTAADQLRRANEFNERLIDTAPTVVLVLDTEGRMVRFNQHLEAITGWKQDEVVGRDWFEMFLPANERVQARELFGRSLAGDKTTGNVNTILAKDGEQREVEWYDAPLTDVRGKLMGLLCTGQDITERKQVEEARRSSDEQLRAILNTASDAMVTIDSQGIIQNANPATETMFGYTREELVGKNVKVLMPPPYIDEHDSYLARYQQRRVHGIIGVGREVSGRRKDGSVFPIGLAVSEVEHLDLFAGVMRDISDMKELQRQVLEIAAEEDRRIGFELHDNIQQQLTGLGLLAQSQAEALTQASYPQADVAVRLAKGIREAAGDVHLLSRGLVPVEVDVEGLRSALMDLASTIGEQYGVDCKFQSAGSFEILDNFTATHMYRIAQEAINNAIKHGKAKRIDISLSGDRENVTMKVRDNGIGISQKRESGRGMGLRIMDYRAGLIGASVRVARGESGGTLVSCTVLRGGGSLH